MTLGISTRVGVKVKILSKWWARHKAKHAVQEAWQAWQEEDTAARAKAYYRALLHLAQVEASTR